LATLPTVFAILRTGDNTVDAIFPITGRSLIFPIVSLTVDAAFPMPEAIPPAKSATLPMPDLTVSHILENQPIIFFLKKKKDLKRNKLSISAQHS
jgi:hypothetical protein